MFDAWKGWWPDRRRRAWFLHAWAIPVAIVGIVCLSLSGDLLSSTTEATHEERDNYTRTAAALVEIRHGHLYPMIFRDGFGGMGSGFPLFYPPFALGVSTFFAWLSGDPVLGVHSSMLASLFASGVAFYALGLAVARSRWLALVGAAVYLTAPYRLTDIHVRGAMAECWTFALWPLLLLGIWRVGQGRRLPLCLPVSAALLLLTHGITVPYAALLCLPFAFLAICRARTAAFARLAVSAVLAAGLAAWFLLPQQIHFPAVKASDPWYMWTTLDYVAGHRVYLRHLLFYDDTLRFTGIAPGFDIELGSSIVCTWIVILGLAFQRRRKDRARFWFGVASVLAFSFCIAAMLFPAPVLRCLPSMFAMIQFPWRLLGPAVFFSAFALVLWGAPLARMPHFRHWALLVVSGLVLAVPGNAKTGNYTFKESAANYTPAAIRATYGRHGFSVLGEYLPREFPIDGEPTAYLSRYVPPRPASMSRLSKFAFDEAGDDGRWRLYAKAPIADEVVVPLVYYPERFAVAEDGSRVPLRSHNGLTAMSIPAGATTYRFDYGMDKWRRLGCAISAATLVLFAIARLLFRRF